MLNNNIVIDVKNLSKSYKLYEKPVDRLKETLNLRSKSYHRDFYALNNITFQVNKGETIGIIGQNGAGKSTLLKIITGVLSPSSGDVIVNGKISSLLELGTGFNPEFTGIENIYLNGTIMGYSRNEMDDRLPAILDFADIGDFIHQPIKIYSSGMYVRLAFSVAINVEPEVLIVDEALSVGDARFQLKCFKKLDEIRSKGTTILLVTHSIEQIKSFCSRGIVLDKGSAVFVGDINEAVVKYYDLIFPNEKETIISNVHNNNIDFVSEGSKLNISDRHENYCIETVPEQLDHIKTFGKGGAVIESFKVYGVAKPNEFSGGEIIRVIVRCRWDADFINVLSMENALFGGMCCGIKLEDSQGRAIFGCNNYDAGLFVNYNDQELMTMTFNFQMPFLRSGTYFMSSSIAYGNLKENIQLKWYDNFLELHCISNKVNVHGFMHIDYELDVAL